MPDIVLVEPHYKSYEFHYVPQGLLSIAAYLEKAGFSVEINPEGEICCDVLGLSATTPQYIDALKTARKARARLVVIGGAHATASVAETMASQLVDFAIVGDGEEAFVNICRGIQPGKICGVAYRRAGVIVVNPHEDIKYGQRDGPLLIPAYHLLEGRLGKHVNVCRNREYSWKIDGWEPKNRPKWWRTFSYEIGALADLGVEEVTITDQNFGCWHENIKTTISALDGLHAWRCRSGVKNVLRGRLDQKLRGSHCKEIEIDVVSGSKRMLREFSGHTIEEAELAIELMEYIGIDVTIRAILGLPGETNDSMLETWKWLGGKRVRLETMSPYPGTEFYERQEDFGRFGYEVVAIDTHSFDADNGTGRVPWRMNTIEPAAFIGIREKMVKELSHGSKSECTT